MTRISSYIIDQNIVGNDKWIGSDAQNNLRTKNFTPNNLADYFNGNNVIDIGTSIRYRYQTLDIGEDREQGTISFETEVGPQVNFSDITTFLIAKNTLKGNTVTEYLDFLVDGKVILSKSSNINTFGYYKVTSIEPWIVDPNFFVVVVEFLDGNGFIYEDLDYLVSLVDKGADFIPTAWGSITGDIEDQTDLINYLNDGFYPLLTNPAGYLTLATLPPAVIPALQEVVEEGRTFNESDGTTQYDFKVFTGSGANKIFSVEATTISTSQVSRFNFSRTILSITNRSNSTDSTTIQSLAGLLNFRANSAFGLNEILIPRRTTGSVVNSVYSLRQHGSETSYRLSVERISKSSSFIAENNTDYETSGTITITDPSSTTRGYTVYVLGGTTTIGGVDYTSGALVYRFYNGTSWFSTNMNNASTTPSLKEVLAVEGRMPFPVTAEYFFESTNKSETIIVDTTDPIDFYLNDDTFAIGDEIEIYNKLSTNSRIGVVGIETTQIYYKDEIIDADMLNMVTLPLYSKSWLKCVAENVFELVIIEQNEPQLQDLESVLTEGNESTTQDAIFRLDADKYIKIDRSNQVIQIFDPTIKAVGACAWIDANGFHSADDIVGQLDVASNYFAYNGLGSVINFSVDGININSGGQDAQFLPFGVVLQQSGSDAQYLIDKISVNNVDYDLPTGATSQIATLLDIPSLTGYVPYTGATADVNLGEFGLLTGNIEFDNTPTNIPTAAGSMYYNDSDGTVDLILKGGNVKLQIGQESVIRVVNKTATNINLLEANYQAVRVTGAQGQRLKVDLAQATTDNLSAETIGLVTETINNNQEGFITTSGLVRNINTTGSLQGETWADGDILYLSPTTAGMITKVKPVAPNHLVIIGYVVHAHITQGSIFVKVDNGYELDELHNVKITGTPANNNLLAYTSSLSVWENKTAQDAGVLTIAVPTTTGVVITFVTDRLYGSIASPETGNITADVTNAQIGVTNIIVHNSGTAPTFGAEFKKLSGSGNYVTSVVNYIYCTYINATEIIYSINQRT